MPAWDEAAVRTLAAGLRLGLDPRRRRHGAGTRLGSGPGASLEFHDHRAYAPGDDLRHLDWRVYGRSDQLMLRRFRQEVAPRVEVLVDGSASLGLAPAKAGLVAALAALLCHLALGAGSALRLWWLADTARRLDGDGRDGWIRALSAAEPAGAPGFLCQPLPRLGPGAERILVGDGLCAEGGPAVLRRLGGDAGRVSLVQVLCREELAPALLGPYRLEDVEGGAAEQVIDAAAVAAYRERLGRLQQSWVAALAGRGAGLVTCTAEEGLQAAGRALLAAGLVEPAGA